MRAVLVLCILATACSGDREDVNADSLTRRERDSIVAGSRVPGASGVRGAMTGADSAAARAARLDSVSREP